MEVLRADPQLLVQCGVAGFVMPGHTQSGDLEIVHRIDRKTLVGVVDGIGHGDEAAAAARLAQQTIIANAREALVTIVRLCHEALRSTRGVVMSLALIDADRSVLSWLAVGNVRGILCRSDAGAGQHDELLLRPGVVGATLPPLQPAVVMYKRYGTLIFATDGIRGDAFSGHIATRASPQVLARNILANHCLGNDDALVLVARLC